MSETNDRSSERPRAVRIGQAAELLGVGVDTLRRWAEDGRLATTRSAGGQRLVPIAEVSRLLSERRRTTIERPIVAQSARNRFAGIVTRIERDGVAAVVEVIAGPHRLVSLMTAEAVASIGEACETGRYPVRKLITIINKAEKQQLVSAVIGTPISAILQQLGIIVQDGDRIIVGGPMTGSAVYLEDYPVMPDTSALVVQDKDAIPFVSDYPCVNCGECVRICPVFVPINMLVRFLEAGHYEEAADQYDLYSCIECGLCSFVCPSKIPIFQFIRLAKYELERMKSAEATNEPS